MTGGIEGSVNNPFQMQNEEMRVRRAEFFEKLDTMGDGTIDQVEFSPVATKMSKWNAENIDFEQALAVYGSHGNGNLGESEFAELVSNLPDASVNSSELNRLFQKYDEDGDGELSIAEFRTFLYESVSFRTAPPESRESEQLQKTLDVEG